MCHSSKFLGQGTVHMYKLLVERMGAFLTNCNVLLLFISPEFLQASRDGTRFIEDLRRSVSRSTGFDAVMRVRASTGLRPTGFFGAFYMSNTTDIELGNVDSDKAIAVEIKHDDKLREDDIAFFQVQCDSGAESWFVGSHQS